MCACIVAALATALADNVGEMQKKLQNPPANIWALDKNLPQVEPAWRQNMRLNLFVGARYFQTKPTVHITSLGDESQIRLEESRWDPFLGLPFLSNLSRQWMINLSGDIGGFGIGNAAKFA